MPFGLAIGIVVISAISLVVLSAISALYVLYLLAVFLLKAQRARLMDVTWFLAFAALIPAFMFGIPLLILSTLVAANGPLPQGVMVANAALILPALVLLAITRMLSSRFRAGLKAVARRSMDASRSEPFILYLRPFTFDREQASEFNSYFSTLIAGRSFALRLSNWFASREQLAIAAERQEYAISFERGFERVLTWATRHHPMYTEYVLLNALEPAGELVAVGLRIGPCSGAARVICPSDDWQSTVASLAARARWIVFVPGGGEGTSWEIENIIGHYRPKTVIVMPPGAISRWGRNRAGRWSSEDWQQCAIHLHTQDIAVPFEYYKKGAVFRQPEGDKLIAIRNVEFLDGARLRAVMNGIISDTSVLSRSRSAEEAVFGTSPYRDVKISS